MWIRCGGIFDHYFITNLLLSLFWKNFWNSSTLDKVMGKSWLPQMPYVPRHSLSCWKMNLLEIWCMMGRNCCNSITLWLILLTDLDSVISKYQSGVMSTNCDLLTDVISGRKIVCRRFVICLSSSLMDMQWVILCVFRSSHGKYAFVNEQNETNITELIFFINCFEWLSLAWEFASLRSGARQFLSTNISQGSVATRLRCGGIFNYCFAEIYC